ncbi:MAG: 30S ribosomal protein S12 methylthiotransferase RimO [Clostridia bacterium]|nr:30S ribosomal protein S12 methylthiotransferase RimO [Clostridia bacterium]
MKIDELKTKKIGMIALGCDKNRVDAEKILAKCVNFGFQLVASIEDADIVIINTCAFLNSARLEAFDAIKECIEYKKSGSLEKIVVTGCLNRYKGETDKELLDYIDEFVPISENEKIISHIAKLYGAKTTKDYGLDADRVITTPSHIAYLKIADGCNNACAYCTIPAIRGKYTSRKIEDIVEEAKQLVKNGVREILLVAQDVTRYGSDLYGELKLINLLEELVKIDNLTWIRLHYCYPENLTDELLQFIKANDKICKYIDMPLQHASDNILKAMKRRNTAKEASEILNKAELYGLSVRSTFIIGFPNETRKDFNALVKFLKVHNLSNVGFFAYSREKYTLAYDMEGQVDEKVKLKRLKKVEKLQTKLYKNRQKKKVGQILDCMIDYYDAENDWYIGRTTFDSYEVDTICYISSADELQIGEVVSVKITATNGIDLIGDVL